MREIKFRGLQPFNGTIGSEKVWIYSESIRYSKCGDTKNVYVGGKQCRLETVGQYSGLKDKNGIEGWAGDMRVYRGKKYMVVDDTWRFRLERNLVEFGENEDITIDEDVMWESELVGNIHET